MIHKKGPKLHQTAQNTLMFFILLRIFSVFYWLDCNKYTSAYAKSLPFPLFAPLPHFQRSELCSNTLGGNR